MLKINSGKNQRRNLKLCIKKLLEWLSQINLIDPKNMQKKAKKEAKEMGGAIEDTIKSIQTKFGEGAIMKFGDSPRVDIDVIPTGSIGLDMALGVGGVPRGRMIEIFGPESSGKTTLALHIVAEAQKKGGVCAYID